MIGPEPSRVWGWPWHGLATGGVIPGSDKAITQPTGGQSGTGPAGCASWLIDMDLPAISLTAEETAEATANNYEWRNYALIYGGRISNIALPNNSYIHVDSENKCWLITLSFAYVAENHVDITATIKRFGLFGQGAVASITKTADVDCEHIEMRTLDGNPVRSYDYRDILLEDVWTNGEKALVGVWLSTGSGVYLGPADLFSVIEITFTGAGGATGSGLTMAATEAIPQSELTFRVSEPGSAPVNALGDPAYQLTGGAYGFSFSFPDGATYDAFCYLDIGEKLPGTSSINVVTPNYWQTEPFDSRVIVGRHVESSFARSPHYNNSGLPQSLRLSIIDSHDHWVTGYETTSLSGSMYLACFSTGFCTDTGVTASWSMTLAGAKKYGYYIYQSDTLIDKLEWVENKTAVQTHYYDMDMPTNPHCVAMPPSTANANKSQTFETDAPIWSGSLAPILNGMDPPDLYWDSPDLNDWTLVNQWRKRNYTFNGEIAITPEMILGAQAINAHAAGLYLRDDGVATARTYGPVGTPIGTLTYSSTPSTDIYFAWQRKTGAHAFSTSPICYV